MHLERKQHKLFLFPFTCETHEQGLPSKISQTSIHLINTHFPMANIDTLPAEILFDIFGRQGLANIARQVCRRWREIALPVWLRRVLLPSSESFVDRGMLAYLRQLSLHDRLYIRALDISAGREFFDCLSTNVSGVHYGDVADQACVENVLLTQSLLGPRIQDLALTDMGWSPSGLRDILDMALLTTRHLHHLQISLFKMESFLLTALLDTLADLVRRDRRQLKTVILDLAQPMSQIQWESLGECTEMQRFHLGLHRTSQPVLTEILDLVLPKWTHLTALYLCQPRSLTAETIRTLYRDLPRPDRLRELHLIFEACQASLYEHEFLEMIEAMPNLQRLEAQMDWTDRMMDRVATTLWDLRELVVTCSNIRFTCFGIRYVVWGAGMEKLNMRTSGKIWGGFLDAVRQRSKKVKVLVYGSMKWGGLVDEWE